MAQGIPFGWQVESVNGTPVSGAKVYTYLRATTTPQTAYSDSGITVPAANPIVADSAGWFNAYRNPALDYTVVIKSADDSITYQSRDYYATTSTGSTTGNPYTVVDTLAELQALEGDDSEDTVVMLGRTAAGDGAHGTFRWVTGDQSANVTLDPGKGIWVAPTTDATGASGAWRRLFDGVVDAAFYGFSTSASAADNTTALNYCLDYLRSVFAGGDITAAGEPPCAMKTGPGQFSVTSVNATKIRSKAWRWDAYGTQLNCATDMAIVVDLTHSRGYTIRNLVIKGDETTPPLRGFQVGYMDAATSSGDSILDGCQTYGKFEQAAYYNGGSEENVLLKCRFRNTNSAQESYAGILDGLNIWGKYSAYLTPSDGDHMVMAVTSVSAASTATVTTAVAHGLTTNDYVRFFDVSGSTDVDQADNLWQVASTPTSTTFTITSTNGSAGTGGYCWKAQANSMVNNNIIETAFFKDNGGRAVWMSSNVQSLRMTGYIYTPDEDAVQVYFRPTLGALTPYSNEFDVAFEGSALKSLFYLYEGESTTQTYQIGNWKIRDHGPQNDEPIFKTNAATSVFRFAGLDLNIAAFTGSSIAVVDTTARYRMQGTISTRSTSSGVISGIPEFYGDLIVPDPALVGTLPAGSYRILCTDFDGSDSSAAIHKGVHHFYGGVAEISGGIENEAQVRVGDKVVSSEAFRSITAFTLADDTAYTIDVPGTVPAGLLHLSSGSSSGINGVYWIRASASPNRVALTSGGTPASFTTGVLTGTTGSDTVFTISPHTDGNVYLENRTGATVTLSYTWISHV